jgi:hypothetical protein
VASLQERNGSFRVLFRYRGKQHAFTLGAVSRDEAGVAADHAELAGMDVPRSQPVIEEMPPGEVDARAKAVSV